jgi:hypothetical protein
MARSGGKGAPYPIKHIGRRLSVKEDFLADEELGATAVPMIAVVSVAL